MLGRAGTKVDGNLAFSLHTRVFIPPPLHNLGLVSHGGV